MAVSKLDFLHRSTSRNRPEESASCLENSGEKLRLADEAPEVLQNSLKEFSANYRYLSVHLDADTQALRCVQRHPGRPCFSRGLLSEVLDLQLTLKAQFSGMARDQLPFHYLVWGSSLPGIYNLGGDLEHFCNLVREQDAEGLHDYARRCIEVCYLNATSLDLPILTAALVQGDALGLSLIHI